MAATANRLAAPDVGNEQPSHPGHAAKAKVEDELNGPVDSDTVVRAAEQSIQPGANNVKISQNGYGAAPVTGASSDAVEVISGPLLNYRRTSDPDGSNPTWHGSVLVVAKSGGKQPSLRLRRLNAVVAKDSEVNGYQNGHAHQSSDPSTEVHSTKLYSDPVKTF